MAKRESSEELKKRTRDIIRRLKRAYPGAKCSLNHSNPFELLVATILSAQCTDERVNIVTADLFRKYTKPEDYLAVSPHELEKDIQSTGFFRNKTKSIQGTAKLENGVLPEGGRMFARLMKPGTPPAQISSSRVDARNQFLLEGVVNQVSVTVDMTPLPQPQLKP